MSFESKDLQLYRAFKAVVMKAKFEVQGEALTQVGALFTWFNSLEGKIDEATKHLEQVKPKRKEV